MNEAAVRTGRGVQAFLLEGTSIDAMPWPEQIVNREALQLGVGLAWHRVPGAAWGQYALMVLVIE